MRVVPAVAAKRFGVFTRAEALAGGWTPKSLRYAVASGALIRIRRDIYAVPSAVVGPHGAASTTDERDEARAAIGISLSTPHTFVSHLAAATILGLPTWAPVRRPCVTVLGPRKAHLGDAHPHWTTEPAELSRRGDGLGLTTTARTVVDIAREFGTESALVTADAAAARGRLTRASLHQAIQAAHRSRGVAQARLLPVLLDSASESPLESRSRWALAAHGLPAPMTQIEIMSAGGEFIGRVDFFWPCGVIGEVDGSLKYTDPSALRREKWRQEALERLGLIVIRWGWADLQRFAPIARRIDDAIDRQSPIRLGRNWFAVPPHESVPFELR